MPKGHKGTASAPKNLSAFLFSSRPNLVHGGAAFLDDLIKLIRNIAGDAIGINAPIIYKSEVERGLASDVDFDVDIGASAGIGGNIKLGIRHSQFDTRSFISEMGAVKNAKLYKLAAYADDSYVADSETLQDIIVGVLSGVGPLIQTAINNLIQAAQKTVQAGQELVVNTGNAVVQAAAGVLPAGWQIQIAKFSPALKPSGTMAAASTSGVLSVYRGLALIGTGNVTSTMTVIGDAYQVTALDPFSVAVSTLPSAITLTVTVADSDLVAAGFSARRRSDLEIFYWDASSFTWVSTGGTYSGNNVSASIERTGIYAAGIAASPSAATSPNLSTVRVYPIPWKPGFGGKFDSANIAGCGQGIIFDNLTSEAVIRIYNVLGDLVREFNITSADAGCKAWDGKNDSGQDVASGIYIAVIKSSTGEKAIKKLAIER
ncbi:MAG: hypothetical protein HY747_12445 [Elusimicrobia bacterium]|nr:hypothetical protein [Elusimicrobiota bacterium]